MKIRVRFGKEDALRFIGHLDVLRTFQKIFRRGGLPMAYSQGFSPHPLMSFALPLGLGLSSEGEYLDAELTEDLDPADILAALQAATEPDLPVYGVIRLPEKCPGAMASVGGARYLAQYTGVLSRTVLEKAAEALLARDSLVITKKTKTREMEADIRPAIRSLELTGRGLELFLSAGSVDNLKPETVLSLLLREAGEEYRPGEWRFRRLDLTDKGWGSLGETPKEN